MYTEQLFEVCKGNHVMLLYEDDNARLDAAVHFINEGLKRGELCIYASVHSFDKINKLGASNLSSRIKEYESNLDEGNLKFIDFRPFYESASASDLSPFLLLKQELESTLQKRIEDGKGDKIMVYADAACCLTEHKQFVESTELETWWQDSHDKWVNNDSKITIICPHPAEVLRRELETKGNIADAHDIMICLNSHTLDASHKHLFKKDGLRILIAESEPDIMIMYSDYLNKMGHEVSVVTNGQKFLSLYRKRDFDLVIVDTHLGDHIPVGNLTKEIAMIEPHQRIIVTSTDPPTRLSCNLTNMSFRNPEVLQKPFHLSTLTSVIKRTASSS